MKQAAFLGFSKAFAQALTFVTAVAMARVFPIEDYGRFVFAQALAAILIVVVDHGGLFQLVQKYSRDRGAAAAGFGRSWAIRILLVAGVAAGAGLAFVLAPADPFRASLTAVVLTGAWFDGVLLLAFAAFRVDDRFPRESWWTIGGAVVRVALTFGAIAVRSPFLPLVALLTLGKAFVALFALGDSRGRVPFPWSGSWDHLAESARESMPFVIFTVTGIAYFQAGTLLVSQWGGAREGAIYQAPYMFFLGGMLVPDAFASAAYPRLARAFAHDRAAFRAAGRRLMLMLLGVAAVLGLGFAFAGPWVLTRVFPTQFSASTDLIPWLGAALGLRSLSYGLGTLLHAADGQNLRAGNNVFALVVLAAAAAVMVPRDGAHGMVHAFLFAELVLVGLEVWGLRAALARSRVGEVLA